MPNPTKLSWQHNGRNTDGSVFDEAQFAGYELELNGQPAVAIPAVWNAGGNYEMPLAGLIPANVPAQYTIRLRVVNRAGAVSDWSAPLSFTVADERKPTSPFGLSVA